MFRSGEPQLAYRKFWILAGYGLLLIILGVSLLPLGQLEDTRTYLDKVLHAITFMLLTLWFTGLYGFSRYMRIIIGLLLFGAAIELLQAYSGYRSMELADFIADVVGVLAGLLLARLGLWRWCEALEKLIMRS